MDIPDRIIDDDTRLWRFKAQIIRRWDPDNSIGREGDNPREYRVLNPVPVFADNKLVGYGCVQYGYGTVWADCAVDAYIPQRLDVEASTHPLYLLPKVTVYAPKMAPPVEPTLDEPYMVWHTWGMEPDHAETVVITGLEIRPDCTDAMLSAIGEPIL